MRILVASDTHGRKRALYDLLYMHKEADWLLFLGDGVRDVEDIAEQFPHISCHWVRGNNDWHKTEENIPLIWQGTIAGKRILMTHGHMQEVKFGEERLLNMAHAARADILLYGHTHRPIDRYEDGMYILNPGSLGYDGTYGIIDIMPNGISTHIASLYP